jgi:hypothetical protein
MRRGFGKTIFDRATLIGLGAIAAGVLILALPGTSAAFHGARLFGIPVEPITTELGNAFVIAGLLSLTLERVLVGRLTEDVRSGVEAYYLTYGLPKEFGDEVMYVRDVQLARKDYVVRIRMWNHEKLPEKVYVEFHVSYTVINFANEDVVYQHHMVIEEVGEDTARIVRASRTGADLSDECVIDVPGTKIDHPVRVRPNARDPRNKFEYVIRKVFAREYGSDYLIMSMPAVGVEVMLEEKPDDIDFEVLIAHRARDEIHAMPEAAPRIWRLDRAFFPGMGVGLEWKKKPPTQIEPGAVSGGQA